MSIIFLYTNVCGYNGIVDDPRTLSNQIRIYLSLLVHVPDPGHVRPAPAPPGAGWRVTRPLIVPFTWGSPPRTPRDNTELSRPRSPNHRQDTFNAYYPSICCLLLGHDGH